MLHHLALALILLATSHISPCVAAALQDGEYEIEVNLELPYILDTHTRKTERLCLGASQSPAFGLVVLSSNNPLSKCAISDVVRSKDTLSFDIICPGLNAARANAQYTLKSESFEGRITMKMGGKNMTMTETQTGHRIGDCKAGIAN